MERNRIKCGYNSCLTVDCKGNGKERAGGISLMWKEQVNVTVTSFSINHITGYVLVT